MKIFFYAFANTSFIFNQVINLSKELQQEIEWGMIYPRGNYKNSSADIVKKENIFYLYETFDYEYKNFDNNEIHFVESFDNIYRIIESSKFGYKKNNSEDQLKNAFIIYKLYKTFLQKSKPDYVIFPDLEVVNGIILYHICKELNIATMCTVHLRILGKRSFFSQDYRDTLPKYFGKINDESLKMAENFLANFSLQKFKPAAMAKLKNSEDRIPLKVQNILLRSIKSLFIKFKYESNIIKDDGFLLRIIMNFPTMNTRLRRIYFEYWQKRFFHIKTNSDMLPKDFILFAMQVTPESSINTFEQYFIDQERAIDLIRLNMPNNYFILAKEHIGARGKRKNSWYKSLRKKVGLQLVAPDVDTDYLVEKSKLVVTVTGTIGLESYIKDKNALMFSQTFFSHLVNQVQCITSFKEELYKILRNKEFDSQDKKITEIAKLYAISYNFFIHEPFHFERVMEKNNILTFLNAIQDHIQRNKD